MNGSAPDDNARLSGAIGRTCQPSLAHGVVFTQPPVAMGPVTTTVFDDTSGNLIQIASMNG